LLKKEWRERDGERERERETDFQHNRSVFCGTLKARGVIGGVRMKVQIQDEG
jgi:hypothetical protein